MSASSYHRRSDCRLCLSKDVVSVLKLEPTPPANAFVPETKLSEDQERFPLELFFCKHCGHVQLLDVVDPDILFKDYVYVSGTSPVFVKHFEDYANAMTQKFSLKEGSRVLDIGSNDGTLLRFFKDKKMDVLGVDPAQEIAKNATKAGIPTKAEFFGTEFAEQLSRTDKPFDLIVSNNMFAHADDLRGITQGIQMLLDEQGAFVFEVSYLVDVYEKTLFDTIYHEHLAYHSVLPLKKFFEEFGMTLFHVESVSSHGGSLRAFVQKKSARRPVDPSVSQFIEREKSLGLHEAKTIQNFAQKISSLGEKLRSELSQLKQEGKKVVAFGAPAKATTLMYHFGLSKENIEFIVDDSPLKQGLYSPGLHIPVLPSKQMYEQKADYAVILAWNFADPIIRNHQEFINQGGHFIVPIPEVKVV